MKDDMKFWQVRLVLLLVFLLLGVAAPAGAQDIGVRVEAGQAGRSR